MPDDALLAETVTITGHGGDAIEAYLARPLHAAPVGGVVVIHHMPGYDRATKEITRRFAELGYAALMPNLYSREAPGASPDDAAAAVRAGGGVPDERLVGDVAGAAAHLRALEQSNGKVGVIGYCSGGRQSFLAAASLDLDAAVVCYGAFIASSPPAGSPSHATPVVDRCERPVRPGARAVRRGGQLPGACRDRGARPRADLAGQGARVPHLRRRGPRLLRGRPAELPTRRGRRGLEPSSTRSSPATSPAEEGSVCTYDTATVPARGSSGKGADGWFALSEATVYLDHPAARPRRHTLNIDFLNPSRGPSARVAVELDRDVARSLAEAILTALDAHPDL